MEIIATRQIEKSDKLEIEGTARGIMINQTL